MATVTLPTPVFVAGGALCLVGGYLLGTTGSPDTQARTAATVASFDPSSGRLCLEGEAARSEPGADVRGQLCGAWRRPAGVTARQGDHFRFVAVATAGGTDLYGGVVR